MEMRMEREIKRKRKERKEEERDEALRLIFREGLDVCLETQDPSP